MPVSLTRFGSGLDALRNWSHKTLVMRIVSAIAALLGFCLVIVSCACGSDLERANILYGSLISLPVCYYATQVSFKSSFGSIGGYLAGIGLLMVFSPRTTSFLEVLGYLDASLLRVSFRAWR